MADADPASSDKDASHELACYTLGHPEPAFIHQYIVDAYAAQHADDHAKLISIAFALAGLYLHLERGYSSRAVQQAHMRLARKKQPWPHFTPPTDRGATTVADVLRATLGAERDEAIRRWAASAWKAWSESHGQVAVWVEEVRFYSRSLPCVISLRIAWAVSMPATASAIPAPVFRSACFHSGPANPRQGWPADSSLARDSLPRSSAATRRPRCPEPPITRICCIVVFP